VDKVEPNLAKNLNDKEDATVVPSTTDNLNTDDNLVKPNTDTVEPNLNAVLIESELPKHALNNTDIFEDNDAIDLNDVDEPKCNSFNIDNECANLTALCTDKPLPNFV
jgi:hypothetical protein